MMLTPVANMGIDLNVKVDYFYSEDFDFSKTNATEVSIEGVDYGQTNTPNIDIGNDGTTVIASYEISSTDESELIGSSGIELKLTIKKHSSSGDLIFTGTHTSPISGMLVVGKTVTSGEIGSASKIWVSVELAIVSP